MVLEQQEEAAQGRRKAAHSLQDEMQIFLLYTTESQHTGCTFVQRSLCGPEQGTQSSCCSIRENSQTHNQSLQCSVITEVSFQHRHMLCWLGEESISPRQNFSLGWSFSRSESRFPSQTPCLSKEGVCGSTGNQKVGEIIIRKCSIQKSLQD